MIKQLFFFTVLILITSCSTAQQYSTKSKKAIKLFEQGKNEPNLSVDPVRHIPNYKGGIAYLNQAIEKDPNFWEAHMVAGEFHETLREYDAAIDHYRKALAINPQRNTSGSTYFFLANLEQATGDYDSAIKNIDLFQQFRHANPELINKSHEMRASCVFAKESMLSPNQFNPINIGPGINTSQPEYFPTITVDGKTILFGLCLTSSRLWI